MEAHNTFMQSQLKLRQPKKNDVEKLLELDELACVATTGRLLSNRNRRREIILSVIKDEPQLIKIAEINGEVVGFGWLGTNPEQDTIISLAVLPEFQNQGVGSKLVTELERQARKMQIEKIIFHTGLTNIKARRFFSRMGYKEIEVKLEKTLIKR